MKPINLISAMQSKKAYDDLKINNNDFKKEFDLKKHEAETLVEFIKHLKENGADFNCLLGYYIGYIIPQINKEFDLLRFSDDCIINIELKSPLEESKKISKIHNQMKKNHYYLKFLLKEIYLYTYVATDGLYRYDSQNDSVEKAKISDLINLLKTNPVNFKINPEDLFVPSNYLVSPFNNTMKFLENDYFLTSHQEDIKRDIIDIIPKKNYKLFCISANAGTGKTLLLYDIAKELLNDNYQPLIIHCGKLNKGHLKLRFKKWKIISIRDLNNELVNSFEANTPDLIIIDEAQRIRDSQLNLLLKKSRELRIPLAFSYDTKQFLKSSETKDIYNYIKDKFPTKTIKKYTLTNKIRTNKEIASFIKNLIHIGGDNSPMNYENITIEYMKNKSDVRDYLSALQTHEGWTAITYTNSRYTIESMDNLADLCENKAHDVIGQEFEKVVFVMDTSFKYNKDGTLMYKQENYYNPAGMLYQIVTRAVKELKIIVLDNPELFFKLLEIKTLTFLKSEK